jgi:prepilin-type N-terminal cleavage/methylation domain-containing protein/prepilin-type processing-associated H-X9-DG protein
MKKQAFTLIEMLVVIAIIALLASILVPTVGSALKRAKSTQSMSNKRQIHQAFLTYAVNHKERLPLTYHPTRQPQDWVFLIGEELGYTWEDVINQGNRPHGVFACPNSDYTTTNAGFSDFGYNRFIGEPPGSRAGDENPAGNFRLSNIENHSQVILLVDMVGCSRVAWPSWGVAGRQSGDAIQVLWLDGHVTAERSVVNGELSNGDDRHAFAEATFTTPEYNQFPWGWTSREPGS